MVVTPASSNSRKDLTKQRFCDIIIIVNVKFKRQKPPLKPVTAAWWNWQTQQIQNLPRNKRAGSKPAAATSAKAHDTGVFFGAR